MESYLQQENQRENDFSAGLRVEVPTGSVAISYSADRPLPQPVFFWP